MSPLTRELRPEAKCPTRAKPARSAVLLSVIVPGLGQCVQRRWVAAFLFFSSFMALLISLIVIVLYSLVVNLKAALAFAEDSAGEVSFFRLPAGLVFVLFCAALVIYVLGVIDAYRVQCRSREAEREQSLSA